MNDATKLFVIYLQDHDAAAQGGAAMARRCAGANSGSDLGHYLKDQFVPEVTSEGDVLVDLLAAVDAAPSQTKRAAIRAGELVGRLKGNGRVLSYSPLSRIIELETLIAGVHAKQRLWVSVGTFAERGDSDLPDVSEHRERAAAQLVELERHHTDAVRIAFAAD